LKLLIDKCAFYRREPEDGPQQRGQHAVVTEKCRIIEDQVLQYASLQYGMNAEGFRTMGFVGITSAQLRPLRLHDVSH
jgi:hypothetical protein